MRLLLWGVTQHEADDHLMFCPHPSGASPPRWNVKKHYSDCLHEVRLRPPASLVFDIKSTALFTAIKFAMSQTGKALGWLHFRCWRMFHARSHAGFYYQQSHQLITFLLPPTFSLLSCCIAKKARQHEWQVVRPFEQYDNSTVKCAT